MDKVIIIFNKYWRFILFIVIILILNHPINASNEENVCSQIESISYDNVVYSQIGSISYEKYEFIDNRTIFNFNITGQIINTSENIVIITTRISDLYFLRITSNLDQVT